MRLGALFGKKEKRTAVPVMAVKPRAVVSDRARVSQFVAERTGDYSLVGLPAIGLEEDGEVIAGATFGNFNGASVGMTLANIPTTGWMTDAYLRALFSYVFHDIGAKRINYFLHEASREAQTVASMMGFKLDARLECMYPSGAMLVYRKLKSDFESEEANV